VTPGRRIDNDNRTPDEVRQAGLGSRDRMPAAGEILNGSVAEIAMP
jgi:hypothetical protein